MKDVLAEMERLNVMQGIRRSEDGSSEGRSAPNRAIPGNDLEKGADRT